jgi:hypothetical protein
MSGKWAKAITQDSMLLRYAVRRKLYERMAAKAGMTLIDVLENWAKVQPNT